MISEINKEKITGGNDVIFKGIMYLNEDIFMKVLEIVLETKIDKIKYLNAELPVREFIEKGKRLDIYIEIIDIYIDVEVTKNYKTYIKNRNLAFECKIYCETVHRGDSYTEYKKVKLINIIFDRKSKRLKREGTLKDQYGEEMSDMLTYSETYIENLKEMYYNEDKENIEKYKYLIMLSLNSKELNEFNEKYGDEIVEKYKNKFDEMMLLKDFEPLFNKEEDERRLRNSAKEEGYLEGISERNIEIAKDVKESYSIEQVSKITKLSLEETTRLKEKLKSTK